MIKRILFPTDFSQHAQKCRGFIIQMKDCGLEEVVLLHVIDDQIIKLTEEMSEEMVTGDRVIAECQRTASRKLQELAQQFQVAGINTRILIEEGVPFAKIMQVAERVDASLVILGHRGHNLAEELLLGSVAEKVARKCKRPVLLIR